MIILQRSKGMLPVAIIGDETFDVDSIDTASIKLEGVSPVKSTIEDISTSLCGDETQDGYNDLLLKFNTRDLLDSIGEVSNDEIIILQITGSLQDGTKFSGEDSVRIIKEKTK